MAKLTVEQTIDSIEALLALDKAGALVPHGIGGLARELFEAALPALRQQATASYSLAFGTHCVFGSKESIDAAIASMRADG